MAIEMEREDIIRKMGEARTELERLSAKEAEGTLTTDDETYWVEVRDRFDSLNEERKRAERNADLDRIARIAADRPEVRQRPASAMDVDPLRTPEAAEDRGSVFGNPWNLEDVKTFGRSSAQIGDELRARALSAVEVMPGASDAVRSTVTEILENVDPEDGRLSRQLLLTASPEYVRAFGKAMRGRSAQWSDDEARAMSLTDGEGGFLVPFQLDPTVILNTDGSYNAIRSAARTVIATGDSWNGVSAGAVSWSWDGEGVEVSDDAPTFTQPTVAIHKAQGYVPISVEALNDAANVTAEIGRLLAQGKDDLESVAFATGSGVGQPQGFVTGLAGTSSELATGAADTFALSDVYALEAALPARYRQRASFAANNSIYSLVRQFDTAGGAGLWERVGNGRPSELVGRAALEVEAMDGTVDALTDNYIMAFGDFADGFVIADRIGMRVEVQQHVTGANGRPTGQRGFYAYYRTGSGVVNPGALRLLNA